MIDARHDRQTLLPGWQQERLTEASVIIIGMGALGNAVAQAMALAGVGHLLLCDMDTIEHSNLSRMPLFGENDIGKSKVEVAAASLKRLAPETRITIRHSRFETGIGLGELNSANLVLACLDSRAARLNLTGRCALVGAPWIDGATGQWSGEVRPWINTAGPCFACGMSDAIRAERDDQRSCSAATLATPVAATAPLSLWIGAHMALLSVRYLMGLPIDQTIKLLDGIKGQISNVHVPRDPSCPYHHPLPQPQYVSLSHLATVEELLSFLGLGAVPLAWQPYHIGATCHLCGHLTISSTQNKCSQCGTLLHTLNHLELNHAPPNTQLCKLGIPPAEIIAVRQRGELRYIQLTGDTHERP